MTIIYTGSYVAAQCELGYKIGAVPLGLEIEPGMSNISYMNYNISYISTWNTCEGD